MKRVLVVEDDKDLRSLFCQILRRANFYAVGVEDGAVGLGITRELFFDLIVCDVNMPKMNGFEFVTALRQEPNTTNIPIVMLSANSEHQYRELAFELGANAYLVKPVISETLLTVVFELSTPQSAELI